MDPSGKLKIYDSMFKAFLATNLDIHLIRRISRWELRNPSIHSCAAVYDCTMISSGTSYQTTYLRLQEEFRGES